LLWCELASNATNRHGVMQKLQDFDFSSLFENRSLKGDVKRISELGLQHGFTAGSSVPAVLFSMNTVLEGVFPHHQTLASSLEGKE